MAESITQDTAYRAVMELKTYTITIRSGKSSGESKTYTVSHGSSWSFPTCPFTSEGSKTFVNYTCNGTTYDAGNSITVTSNLIITCNWSVNLIGKKVEGRYWCSDDRSVGVAVVIDSYDPEVEGETITIDYYTGGSETKISKHIKLGPANINKKIRIATVADENDYANDCYGEFFGQVGTHIHQGLVDGPGRLFTITYRAEQIG